MQKPRGNTSLCAIANRFVFIFQGLATNTQPNFNNVIEFIDLGNFDQPSLRSAKWEAMAVHNNEFITCEPRGSAQIS